MSNAPALRLSNLRFCTMEFPIAACSVSCGLSAILLAVAPPAAATDVDATVAWARKAVLSAPVSGVIETVHVSLGMNVKKGQPLLSLDPREFQAQVKETRAKLDRVLPELEEAKRELARARELYDLASLSDHELQVAEMAVARADAERRIAESALARAELAQEQSVVRAPFNGIVVERWVEEGETVVTRLQSRPLVTIAESGKLLARAELLEDRLSGLRVGQSVSVTVDGRHFDGTVQYISPEPTETEEGDVRYAVAVLFRLPPGIQLRVGGPAKFRMP